jgi:DedD protein
MSNVSEELLQLRKRARRRLVGAIALVVFALIVLWTALDGEPPANLAASRPVEIVSSSTNLASTVIAVPLHPQASQASQAEKAPVPTAQAASVAVATTVLQGRIVNHQTEINDTITEPLTTPTRKPAAASQPAARPVQIRPTVAPKPTTKPVQRDPRLILEGHDDDAVKPASGKFFVQVAAFADAAKAAQIVGKLKKAGLPAYSEKVKTSQGELTRVRIGPAADRAHAADWLKKAQAQGVSGQVVSK